MIDPIVRGFQEALALRDRRCQVDEIVKPPHLRPRSIWPGHIAYIGTNSSHKGFFPIFEVPPEDIRKL